MLEHAHPSYPMWHLLAFRHPGTSLSQMQLTPSGAVLKLEQISHYLGDWQLAYCATSESMEDFGAGDAACGG